MVFTLVEGVDGVARVICRDMLGRSVLEYNMVCFIIIYYILHYNME